MISVLCVTFLLNEPSGVLWAIYRQVRLLLLLVCCVTAKDMMPAVTSLNSLSMVTKYTPPCYTLEQKPTQFCRRRRAGCLWSVRRRRADWLWPAAAAFGGAKLQPSLSGFRAPESEYETICAHRIQMQTRRTTAGSDVVTDRCQL